MDKALNYLSLARKAGKLELGEEPVGSAARAQKARLVMVASDASDHTWRRAKSFVAGTGQICIRLPYSKNDMGAAVGRQDVAIAALTDPAMGVALIRALPNPEKYGEALEELTRRADRIRRHRDEEKAHQRNLKRGKRTKK